MLYKKLLYRHMVVPRLVALLIILAMGQFGVPWAHAEQLGSRSVMMSTARPGAEAEYTVSLTPVNNAPVGSVRIEFCANSPLVGSPCTAPPGFDASQAVLLNQSGMTGFSVVSAAQTNTVILTRTPGAPQQAASRYVLAGMTNPSGAGSFYARLQTYASTDASGSANDYGGAALATANDVTVKTYVPPYMLFCVGATIQPYDCNTASGSYINFGELSATEPRYGSTQLLLSTNAGGGYNIHVLGTTLMSGNNVITALEQPGVSRPGVSQFGINLRANGTPPIGANVNGPGSGQPAADYARADYYKFLSGDMIASSPREDDLRLYTVSAVVNRSNGQPPGVYVSTLTFVATATF